jgi:hypothetical protein
MSSLSVTVVRAFDLVAKVSTESLIFVVLLKHIMLSV